MSASTEPAIRAVGLSKVYRSGDADLVVFSGLNLEVAQGEKLALVGESGSGKEYAAAFTWRSGQANGGCDILRAE